jgi:methylenetetrahydrofolate dehydrogenase (NADP+) / methenyltetrahydrofolate cyclohydrolase
MTAKLIDGKAHAAALIERITADTALLKQKTGIVPGLAVVLVWVVAEFLFYVS